LADTATGSGELNPDAGDTQSLGRPTPPPLPTPLFDRAELSGAWARLFQPDQVVEVRVLDGVWASGQGYPKPLRGYFSRPEDLISSLANLSGWAGVYTTLNAFDPDLRARCNGRLEKGEGTRNDEISRRTELLIDVDPVRPSGVSSSDAEHQAAIDRAKAIRGYLAGEGWPEPLLIDSGNGAHLRYAVDLDRDDGGSVQGVLKALDHFFSDERCHIDTSVHDPARIARFPGTKACKGDSILERPHRVARILEGPKRREPVDVEKLAALRALGEGAVVATTPTSSAGSGHAFDVPGFLAQHGIEVAREAPWVGGRKWVLARCPMDSAHAEDRGSWVAQFPNGAIAAGCHHERCTWKWKDLRDRFEPRQAVMPGGSGAASRAFRVRRLHLGQRVRAHDQDNIGTVIDLHGNEAEVKFVSPEGNEATVSFQISELSPLGGDDDEDLPPREIKLYTLEELERLPRQPWVVPGVIRRKELAVLYGAPGAAKTFLAIDLACHLAAGTQWHRGRAPARPMRVIYICAEGGHEDILYRVLAWHAGMEEERGGLMHLVEANLRVVPEPVQIPKSSDLEGLRLEINKTFEQGVDLIIFDTLARCSVDTEENSSKEMGKLVAKIDAFRAESTAAVILVHHEGKDPSGRERGSSALRGAADLMVRVGKGENNGEPEVSDNGLVPVRCDKAKRQKPFARFEMRLTPYNFNELDADGEPIESAWLRLIPDTEPGVFDEQFASHRVCLAVVDVLQNRFKADEHPSSGDLIAALKSKKVTKNKLFEHRGYGQKCGWFDWYRDGRATRWKLCEDAAKASDDPLGGIGGAPKSGGDHPAAADDSEDSR